MQAQRPQAYAHSRTFMFMFIANSRFCFVTTDILFNNFLTLCSSMFQMVKSNQIKSDLYSVKEDAK